MGPTISDCEESGIEAEVQLGHGTPLSAQGASPASALIRRLRGTTHMADIGLASGRNKNIAGLETEYLPRGGQRCHLRGAWI
jgi:hypothetical protein